MSNFVQIPNDTIRDERLSLLARGLLAVSLSHAESWRHDGAEKLWQLGRAARGKHAEGLRIIQAALAELERYGYRHRLTWRGPRGMENEIRYVATPGLCGDVRCRSPRCALAEPLTHNDLGEHDVSAGRPEYAVSGGSQTARSSENHQAEDHQKNNSAADVEPPEFMCDYGDDWTIDCQTCHQPVLQTYGGELWDNDGDRPTPHLCRGFSSVPITEEPHTAGSGQAAARGDASTGPTATRAGAHGLTARSRKRRGGRQRTAQAVELEVVRMAEETGWAPRRIGREAGMPSEGTIYRILRDHHVSGTAERRAALKENIDTEEARRESDD